MARRSTPRLVSNAAYDSPADDPCLPPAIVELLASKDPALADITIRLTTAKLSGADVTDPNVLESCIAEGRADYVAKALGGVA